MGAGRREHHRQEEAKRRANDEANRYAEQIRMQQEAERQRMEAMRRAMEQQTKSMMEASKAPTTVKSTIGAETGAVSTARSRRKATRAVGGGASALRIPLNIGGTGGGLNIG